MIIEQMRSIASHPRSLQYSVRQLRTSYLRSSKYVLWYYMYQYMHIKCVSLEFCIYIFFQHM